MTIFSFLYAMEAIARLAAEVARQLNDAGIVDLEKKKEIVKIKCKKKKKIKK